MVPRALGEEQRLPWSGMDLCNVIQSKLVDERRIGYVLLDFILMTLSQNWGTHVELVAKTRKGSNSLLISLKMWSLDLFINLF